MNYIHNCISEVMNETGFTSFNRFYDKQIKIYQKDAMSKAMSMSTAGIYLGFSMTGQKIAFTCKMEKRLRLLLPIARQVKLKAITKMIKKISIKDFYPQKQKSMMDGIDLVVDGKLQETVKAKNGRLHLHIDNPNSEKKEVRIYFPAIESLSIKDLRVQGKVNELPTQKSMLCLGDSITQGMISGGPSLNYVALLGQKLGLDALNQGVGGYVFNEQSLNGLEDLPKPELITVAYGTNDWTNQEHIEQIQKDIRSYFRRLADMFADVPIYAITPIWRADEDEKVNCNVPLQRVGQIIVEETADIKNVQIIDGYQLVDHDRTLFADSFLHPNAKGFAQMADRLLLQIKHEFQ